MDIEIREGTLEDTPIVAWTVLTALDLPTDDINRFIDICSDPNSMYSWTNSFIAFVEGRAIGCLIAYDGSRYQQLKAYTWEKLWNDFDKQYLEDMEPETHEGEFYLDSMAIKPEYRGINIGNLLIDFAIGKAVNLNIPISTLLVDCNKPRLETYYKTMGFVENGHMIFFDHEYIRMKKSTI